MLNVYDKLISSSMNRQTFVHCTIKILKKIEKQENYKLLSDVPILTKKIKFNSRYIRTFTSDMTFAKSYKFLQLTTDIPIS